ncbi:MAG: FG-GAP-like repeat-containing protein [Thermodesulfobacteriota bacterium]
MKKDKRIGRISILTFAVIILGASIGWTADPVLLRQLAPPSLKLVPIPEPSNLNEYVVDRTAAIVLGKALFWDMQVGSDGVQACASCHFHAGADRRFKNELDSGLSGGDTTFQVAEPNAALIASHFPFHQRANPDFQNSPIVRDVNDVASSQGVFLSQFVDIIPGSANELVSHVPDPVFNVGGVNTRRVEPRNAPTVINAVFNFANFWDGRANNIFNGINPFGPADLNARIWANNAGVLTQVPTAGLNNSSLASQAVGPPVSDFEMSSAGRPFPKIGKKMLSLTPLAKQKVSPTDSVLGAFASPNRGLNVSYSQLIQQAFNPAYWNSTDIVVFANGIPAALPNPGRPLTTDEFTQMEANFSLFFGLALQLYQATLVSDETPFDRFAAGDNNALTAQQLEGLDIFVNQGKCINCHFGAEFTTASVTQARFLDNTRHALIESVPQVQDIIIYDEGYYNVGLRPTTEDLGRGGAAPFINPLTGNPFPLSFVSLAELQLQGLLPFPSPQLSPAFPINFIRASKDGRFKAPGLRNVDLTGPYFHNGGAATLEEVVDFYTRGGNFPHVNIADIDPEIAEIPFLQGAPDRMANLVAFLKSLTDERVRREMAPFDHPQLFVPNGHPGDDGTLTCINGGNACDSLVSVPAVGAGGRPDAGLPPLRSFLTGAKYSVFGDFDKDGKTDITVWRGGDGFWYNHRSSDGGVIQTQWGTAALSDLPVPGDYDGDGKADIAVWRPGDGYWYIKRSSDGVVLQTPWGAGSLNDVPVPGDYDGDGKADIAVWRPGDGFWYIKRSSDGVITQTAWGTGSLNDVPVPGDYDGDGKADVGVWRPGDGNWYIKRSSDGVVSQTPWGTGSLNDVPVPGDYDGDGITDVAVWRPGDGFWHIKRSSDGLVTQTPWGTRALNDVPIPGDYDGDGMTDIGVYRPGSGDWYVIPSGGEDPFLLQWGGDVSDQPLFF